MEKAYWLARKRASLKMARSAASAETRLVHFDLAGRYSVNAMATEIRAQDVAKAVRRSPLAASGPAVIQDSDHD
jgi:hypothetical protein